MQIDVRLDEVVLRALNEKPELRWQTAHDLKTQVETISNRPAAMLEDCCPPYSAFAVSIALFYVSVIIGILAVGVLPVNRDAAYLTLVAVALFASVGVGMRCHQDLPVWWQSARSGCRGWLKALGGAALVASFPVIGFAGFFIVEFIDSGWDNPAPSEAVLVPLTIIGALLLPFSAWVLLRSQRPAPAVPTRPLTTIHDWLRLMDSGNYADTWATAHPSFKMAVTEAKWVSMVESVRQPLGAVISRTLRARCFISDQIEEIKFNTSYEALPDAVETLTVQQGRNQQLQVIGYLIRPAEFTNALERWEQRFSGTRLQQSMGHALGRAGHHWSGCGLGHLRHARSDLLAAHSLHTARFSRAAGMAWLVAQAFEEHPDRPADRGAVARVVCADVCGQRRVHRAGGSAGQPRPWCGSSRASFRQATSWPTSTETKPGSAVSCAWITRR